MDRNSHTQDRIRKEYHILWSDSDKIKRTEEDMLLGWHFGYYEKGIKNDKEAMHNMNRYVSLLLDIDKNKPSKILDCGCGVGGTAITIAKKYPNVEIYGITLAKNEIEYANKLKENFKIQNAKFLQKSYYDTGFNDNFFDKIYALESFSYARDQILFLKEMSRILKPNGKLIIIDLFRRRSVVNSYVDNLECNLFYNKVNTVESETINTFQQYLKKTGFDNTQIKDLVKSKNVNYLKIYGFMIAYLYGKLHRYTDDYKQKKSVKLKLALKFLFLLKVYLLFKSKGSYFSITTYKR